MMHVTFFISFTIALLLVFSKQLVHSQPPNDECNDATTIPSVPYMDTIPNFIEATNNPNDPKSSCNFDNQVWGVWYLLNVPVTGSYDISTRDTTYGTANGILDLATYITIFEGDECGTLQEVQCEYGTLFAVELLTEKKYFFLLSYKTYDHFVTSNVVFTVIETPPPPPNDECVDATMIPITNIVFPYVDIISNFSSATYNSNDVKSYCNYYVQKRSVWYKLKPSHTRSYEFSTISARFSGEFGTNELEAYITVFEGEECGVLHQLQCRFRYLGAVVLVAEKTYFVLLEEPDYSFGSYTPTVALTITESPPSQNDECADAIAIPNTVKFPYTTEPVYLAQATQSPNDPNLNCNRRFYLFETVWYVWIPTFSDYYAFNIEDTGLNGLLIGAIGIFKGATCDSLEQIGCKIESTAPCNTPHAQSVSLNAGVKYYIMVQTNEKEKGSNLVLTVKPSTKPPPIPPNDECISAITVDPFVGGSLIGDISSASLDKSYNSSDNYCGTYLDNPGAWYKITNALQTTIFVNVSYVDAAFYTRISVFKGDGCGYLECVGGSESLELANFQFLAAAETTHYILAHMLDSYCVDGRYELSIEGSKNFFTLIDSKTDKAIEGLRSFIDYRTIASKSSSLNIEAIFADPSSIRSVMLTFDDPSISYCENKAPYSVFRDSNGDFRDAIISIGEHVVTATAYTRQGCKGRAKTSITKSFDVYPCFFSTSFVYINESLDYIYLYDGAVLEGGCNSSIQVFPYCGFEFDSVTFVLRNKTSIVHVGKEKADPYFLFGNVGDIVNKRNIEAGDYSLEIIVDGLKSFAVETFTILDNGSCNK